MYDFISFVPTDPLYAVFHDEEWGVPVHDDKYVTSTIFNSYCQEVLMSMSFKGAN